MLSADSAQRDVTSAAPASEAAAESERSGPRNPIKPVPAAGLAYAATPTEGCQPGCGCSLHQPAVAILRRLNAGDDDPFGGAPVPEASASLLARRRGQGEPLPTKTAQELGDAFGGHDLRDVRIHRDAEADTLTQQMQATAFAYGSDIYFSGSTYQPQSDSGTRLLAHEVAHVVQQTPGAGHAGEPTIGRADDPAEAAADRAADAAMINMKQNVRRSQAAGGPAASSGLSAIAALRNTTIRRDLSKSWFKDSKLGAFNKRSDNLKLVDKAVRKYASDASAKKSAETLKTDLQAILDALDAWGKVETSARSAAAKALQSAVEAQLAIVSQPPPKTTAPKAAPKTASEPPTGGKAEPEAPKAPETPKASKPPEGGSQSSPPEGGSQSSPPEGATEQPSVKEETPKSPEPAEPAQSQPEVTDAADTVDPAPILTGLQAVADEVAGEAGKGSEDGAKDAAPAAPATDASPNTPATDTVPATTPPKDATPPTDATPAVKPGSESESKAALNGPVYEKAVLAGQTETELKITRAELLDALETLPDDRFARAAATLMLKTGGVVDESETRTMALDILTIQMFNKKVARQLLNQNVEVIVIPKDKRMTDVVQFDKLKGTKTFDGRPWEDVRGAGGFKVPGENAVYVAVSEENITGADYTGGGSGVQWCYAKGYSTTSHEFAHVIDNYGLSAEDRKVVDDLYAAKHSLEDTTPQEWIDGFNATSGPIDSWKKAQDAWTAKFGADDTLKAMPDKDQLTYSVAMLAHHSKTADVPNFATNKPSLITAKILSADGKQVLGPDGDVWASIADDGAITWTGGTPAKKTECYASVHRLEYFAQTANAYLGTNAGNDPYTKDIWTKKGQPEKAKRRNGKADVKRVEPGLYPLLEKLFGPEGEVKKANERKS